MPRNKHKNKDSTATYKPEKRKHAAAATVESPSTPAVMAGVGVFDTSDLRDRIVKVEPDTPSKKPKLTSSPPTIDATFNHVILVQVGAEKRHFGIHDGLLRQISSIFAAALDPINHANFEHPGLEIVVYPTDANHTANKINLILPNEDSNTFTRINRWIYSQSLLLETEDHSTLSWAMLIDIYLFAIKYKVTRLQNQCIDTTIKKFNHDNRLPNAENIARLWRADPDVKPMRQLLLQIFARNCDLAGAMAAPGKFHADFMKGLVMLLYQIRCENDNKEGAKGIHFWKKRREWYVNDVSNPIPVDDDSM